MAVAAGYILAGYTESLWQFILVQGVLIGLLRMLSPHRSTV